MIFSKRDVIYLILKESAKAGVRYLAKKYNLLTVENLLCNPWCNHLINEIRLSDNEYMEVMAPGITNITPTPSLDPLGDVYLREPHLLDAGPMGPYSQITTLLLHNVNFILPKKYKFSGKLNAHRKRQRQRVLVEKGIRGLINTYKDRY